MSKIGKLPIKLPTGVTVEVNPTGSGKDTIVTVSGSKGAVQLVVSTEVEIKNEEGALLVILKRKSKNGGAIHGTTRAKIANAVWGVSQGWNKQLELVGTGFRAEVNGNTLILTIGYSHPVKIEAPSEISFKVEKSIITIEGVDKEVVGQIAAKTRGARPPEPYQGKGIKYVGEVIRRKAGKTAKTVGAA